MNARNRTSIEKSGTGIEKSGTGIEKSGTGIEKSGTGIEKSGTGMLFSLMVASVLFVSGISGSAIASSFDGAVYSKDGNLFITLATEDLVLTGAGQLDSGYGIVRIDGLGSNGRLIGRDGANILIEGSGTGKPAASDGTLIEGSGTGKPAAADGTLIEGSGTGDAVNIEGSGTGDAVNIEGSGTGAASICGPAGGVLIEGSGTGDAVAIEGSGTGDAVNIEGSGTGDSVNIEGSGTGKSAPSGGVLIEGSGTGVSSIEGRSFVMIEGSGTGVAGNCDVNLEWGYAEIAVDGNVASVLLFGLAGDGNLIELAAIELPVIEQ